VLNKEPSKFCVLRKNRNIAAAFLMFVKYDIL